ncbi:MAG TPA: hypothetical protein PLO41_19375 [Rubrivivax sp.]|nr:hypothetical protein [Rubrivivax sp.]
MTQTQHPVANPFALLMDPQSIFRAIEKSERLERLHSRVCRPLDKPLLPVVAADEAHDPLEELDLPGEEI